MKSWHIWDFPDSVYILLKEDVHKEFFNYVFDYCGGKRPYARFLSTSQMQVKQCFRAYTKKNNKKYVQYIPLSFLKKSYNILSKELTNRIEEGIKYIRVRSGNPVQIKLPIIESPKLYRIVAHLLADGFAGKRKVPYYANTCNELREQFKEDLKIFGDLDIYEITQNTISYVFFPKVITNILSHIFDIEFTRPNKLPNLIFNAHNECKKYFLRALFDDEGYISTTLALSMNNKNLVEDIKKLIENLNVWTNKIYKLLNKEYYTLQIKAKEYSNFKKRIGFSHPEKVKKLEFALKVQERNKIQRTRPLKKTRNKIINLLKIKPMKTLELSHSLLLTVGGLYYHLNFLEKESKIKKSGYKNKVIWKLT